MPIYDYTCSNCGHLTEVVHGIHDSGPKFCPECGAEGTMTKAFAPPAIVFKGSGWAKKDRSTSSKPSSAKKDDSPAKAGTSSGDSGSAPGAASSTTATPGSASSSSGGGSSSGASSGASSGD